MTHYVICPYSKPEYRDNLVAALNRQTYRDFTPVIVENGPAVGTFPQLEGAVVLQSGAHQSLAKNVALQWIRDQGDASWSCFDCDDYYGKDYLTSQLKALEGADLVGKSFGNMMYVSYEDGLYINCPGTLEQGKSLTGGAMTCRTAVVPDFPIVPVGEDGHWSWEMISLRQAKLVHTGPRHYCYNRGGTGHTWDLGSAEERIKKGMRFLGVLPLQTVEQSPRIAMGVTEQVVNVVMLYTPDYTPAQVSVPDVQRYCDIWDYPLTVYTDRVVPEWPAAWGKIVASLKALKEAPEGAWVMWMDADMLFRRNDRTLESLIEPGKDFMISTDANGICTGLFLIRNTPLMQAFFEDLLKDVRQEWPWEQNAMKDLLASRPDYQERVGLISPRVVANPSSGRCPTAFVMHYWGNGYPNRDSLMRQMKKDIYLRNTGRNRGRLFSS